MCPRTAMVQDEKTTAARAFVRSVNILLKFVRLYGFEHSRTTKQFDTTWLELRTALSGNNDKDSGLLLGASGGQLLLDGVPLATTPAERSFAQLLSAAGLASIHFSPQMTQADLAKLVRAFPVGGATPAELAQRLKEALADTSCIRLNEVRFVAEEVSLSDAKIAAQLTARSLGINADEMKTWLNDPQKLLQLIVAARGANSTSGAAPAGASAPAGATATAGTDSAPVSTPARTPLKEDEMTGILRLLAQAGQASSGTAGSSVFQQQLSKLPPLTQEMLQQALMGLTAQAHGKSPDQPVLLKLAEHLAIRFALERYERGEVRVNAVRQLLERMNQEIEGLRKILGTHEDKMAKAGIMVESHTDLLDRQFWAAVPESGKRAVLNSFEAWCIPPRNIRQYVEELLARGDEATAHRILLSYASCIALPDAGARRKTAIGLSELADVYGKGGARLLVPAIRHAGVPLDADLDPEVQSLVGATFVHLSQEASKQRCYPALQQTMNSLESVERKRPGLAQTLRLRVVSDGDITAFIEDALRASAVPVGLAEVLRLVPRPATEHLISRFNRTSSRKDCDRLAELASGLGSQGAACLREILRAGSGAEATEAVGLLSRLDITALTEFLPGRIHEWSRVTQDRVVRHIAASGAPARGRLLLGLFKELDPLIQTLAVDEIGMSADREAVTALLALAEGTATKGSAGYLRLKAIEALGRLCATSAALSLRKIVEAKQMFRWTHPPELRVAALQALGKIDPEWTAAFLPRSGFSAADLALAPLDPVEAAPWLRQRRYARLRLAQPLIATVTTDKESCPLEIKSLSLGGGLATIKRHLAPGTYVSLKLQSGLRGLRATAVMRDWRAQDVAFEIADMDLEERSRFRRLLITLTAPSALVLASPTPERSPQAILTPR